MKYANAAHCQMKKCYLKFMKSKHSNCTAEPAEKTRTRQLDYSLSHEKYVCTLKTFLGYLKSQKSSTGKIPANSIHGVPACKFVG